MLAERLQLRGFDTSTAYDAKSALSLLETNPYNYMILDLRLPDIDGTEVLPQAMALRPDLHVVVLSGHANQSDFAVCLSLGAKACLQKPAKFTDLIDALSKNKGADDTFRSNL